eukprot:1141661-Pelagomonas_calceolata.AAC.3
MASEVKSFFRWAGPLSRNFGFLKPHSLSISFAVSAGPVAPGIMMPMEVVRAQQQEHHDVHGSSESSAMRATATPFSTTLQPLEATCLFASKESKESKNKPPLFTVTPCWRPCASMPSQPLCTSLKHTKCSIKGQFLRLDLLPAHFNHTELAARGRQRHAASSQDASARPRL